jgi:hypothetical protein
LKKNNKTKSINEPKSINLILLGISLIIFGGLGLMVVTQMELHQGWTWEDFQNYPIDTSSIETGDINNDGINEIAVYMETEYPGDRIDEYENLIPNFGAIVLLDGKSGSRIWCKEYNGAVEKLYSLPDFNGDGKNEFFTSIASVDSEWLNVTYDDHGVNRTSKTKEIYPNQYRNYIINGSDGEKIPILSGDGFNVSNLEILDFLSFQNTEDNKEDFICLQYCHNESDFSNSFLNFTGYFKNGTIKNNFRNYVRQIDQFFEKRLLHIDHFNYEGESHMLFTSRTSLILFNLSSQNYEDTIYNKTINQEIAGYEIVEDLTLDGINEILVIRRDGYFSLFNGKNGNIISNFTSEYEDLTTENVFVDEIQNNHDDGITYFIFEKRLISWDKKAISIYSLDLSQIVQLSKRNVTNESDFSTISLNYDIDGDGISEVITSERIFPIGTTQRINRYKIINIINNEVYAIINSDIGGSHLNTISDFDGDSQNDFMTSGWERIYVISSKKPTGIWLSSIFPFGFPIFIILCVLMLIGVILIILNGRKIEVDMKQAKKSRLAIIVNGIVLTIMTLNVIFFISMLNVFNSTLIIGAGQSNIIINYLIVIIMWYGLLPLTAAVYNQFAPQFAYFFIRLRNAFFKIRKAYEHKIIVIDMESRQELTTTTKLTRVILPLLLSIAIAFYAYNNLAPLFGYPTNFDQFGGTQFFNFMIGYIIFGIIPMIVTFLVFSFFISGNFLLDDAGVVYYAKPLRARKPSDIEPISVWAQSIVKGIAGFSALITFGAFLISIDLSGFFEEGDLAMAIVGVLLTIVLFYGTPFLTAFSYILLAIEIMNFSHKENTQRLYKIMEKNGIDTKPYDISSLFSDR